MAEAGELSYSEFLALLKSVPTTSTPKKRSVDEIVQELCFDFPSIPLVDLQSLKTALMIQLSEEKQLFNFPISKAFLNGITYGATPKMTGQASDPTLPVYQSLCGITFIKLYKNMLRSDLENLDALLRDFDKGVVDMHPRYDGDSMTVTDTTWETVEKHLSEMCMMMSYDFLANPNVWDELNLPRDIAEICRLITSHKHLHLDHLMPYYIFLLRDRMIEHPQLIPSLLPIALNILNTDGNAMPIPISPINLSNGRIAVAIFSALTASPKPSKGQEICQFIVRWLPFFSQRLELLAKNQIQREEMLAIVQILAYWTSSHVVSYGSAQDETANLLISTGIWRDLLQLWSQSGSQVEMSPIRKILLLNCLRHPSLAEYVILVPGFLDSIRKPEFQEKYPADSILWEFAFSINLKNKDDHTQLAVEKMKALTEKENWSVGHLGTLVEILQMLVAMTTPSNRSMFNKSDPFNLNLVNLQERIRRSENFKLNEETPILEKEMQQINLIRQLLKNIMGGKAE
eukprot:TRINITY_DN10261_c0_g1_i1.p1 TRINITY_DN10261_c0_g1~~TRINITY_DN10261_c0_g1_i1.p1  ORF type:complete len:523 (-),score=149.93 TRINITY_DN10261_c0_g1_i1:9-1553(-)